MTSRGNAITSFLKENGWNNAQHCPLAADFSSRRYVRLVKSGNQKAILMDADSDQKTDIFVGLAKVLRDLELSAPEIYAADPDQGLVLMQDFGTRNVGRLLDQGAEAKPFFLHATDVLTHLHKAFTPALTENLELPLFTTEAFVTQTKLFLDAYFPIVTGRVASEEERLSFAQAWQDALSPLDALPQSLLLRDFMPDNLMALQNGTLGILDFQDAGIGPVAYDIASLCEDVRRDGGFALLDDVLAHYHATRALDPDTNPSALRSACLLCSAQRHTRVLGIIAKRSITQGLCDKFAFLPRIRHHLSSLFETETALVPVKNWFNNFDRLLQ